MTSILDVCKQRDIQDLLTMSVIQDDIEFVQYVVKENKYKHEDLCSVINLIDRIMSDTDRNNAFSFLKSVCEEQV